MLHLDVGRNAWDYLLVPGSFTWHLRWVDVANLHPAHSIVARHITPDQNRHNHSDLVSLRWDHNRFGIVSGKGNRFSGAPVLVTQNTIRHPDTIPKRF